jgi:hypothetical protein
VSGPVRRVLPVAPPPGPTRTIPFMQVAHGNRNAPTSSWAQVSSGSRARQPGLPGRAARTWHLGCQHLPVAGCQPEWHWHRPVVTGPGHPTSEARRGACQRRRALQCRRMQVPLAVAGAADPPGNPQFPFKFPRFPIWPGNGEGTHDSRLGRNRELESRIPTGSFPIRPGDARPGETGPRARFKLAANREIGDSTLTGSAGVSTAGTILGWMLP